MPTRLPRANYETNQYTNSNLSTVALAIVNGLTAAIATFPTPPIDAASLQALLNNYNTALAASIGGSELQRAEMRAAREVLRGAITQDGIYVNTVVWGNIATGTNYTDAQTEILSSGYQLGKDPTPVGPIAQAIVKKFSSPAPGQLYALVYKLNGARTYTLKYRITGTDPSTAQQEVFPNTRILKTDFLSGQSITASVFGNGSSGISTESEEFTQIII